MPPAAHRVTAFASASADGAWAVLYMTERCVSRLTAEGLGLTEIAPGVDLKRNVLARMGFAPVIRHQPKLMDPRLFQPGLMGLKHDMLSIPIADRFNYGEAENLLFVNLERLSVTTAAHLERIVTAIDEQAAAIGHRVYAIANYDNVYIAPDLMDGYSEAVRRITERYCPERDAVYDQLVHAAEARERAAKPRRRCPYP